MSSMLIRLTDTEYKPSFWEAFWERWLPVSKVEAEALLAVKARAQADTALFEAEAARIQQEIDQKRVLFDRDLAEKDQIRKGEQLVAKALADSQKEKEILQKQLRPVFIAKMQFKRGGTSGFTLITQLGESKDGTSRGSMSQRVIAPGGTVAEFNQSTKEWFYTTRLWTNLVYPWVQHTISTEDVKAADFQTFNVDGSKNGWVEFPLTSPKSKEK